VSWRAVEGLPSSRPRFRQRGPGHALNAGFGMVPRKRNDCGRPADRNSADANRGDANPAGVNPADANPAGASQADGNLADGKQTSRSAWLERLAGARAGVPVPGRAIGGAIGGTRPNAVTRGSPPAVPA
jgi:hypothetical protein